MKGFMVILVAFAGIYSAAASTYSTTKTDDVQGLGEFQPMVLLADQAPGQCYICTSPCDVAGKGCCSITTYTLNGTHHTSTLYKQCRQVDGTARRCTQQ